MIFIHCIVIYQTLKLNITQTVDDTSFNSILLEGICFLRSQYPSLRSLIVNHERENRRKML